MRWPLSTLALAAGAFTISVSIGPAVAEGACPSGYYQSNQSGYGYVACAPIPEAPPPVRMPLRWGAVAGDDDGHWGMSESRRFRLQATREALKRCRENGGKGCRLAQVYGDSCVAIASDSNTASVLARQTREEAVAAALKDCAGYARGGECAIKYSACSQL